MNVNNKALKSNILTEKELKFIDNFLLHGNAALAVKEAGYTTKEPYKYVQPLKFQGLQTVIY